MNMSKDEYFGALANPTRLRILALLHASGELCVCELTHAIGVPQPTMSRHLAHLRELGLVADRRAGHWIYYRLHPQLPPWLKDVLAATFAATASEEPFAGDRAALEAMPNRPGAACCA